MLRKSLLLILIFLVFFSLPFKSFATTEIVVDNSKKVYDIYSNFSADFIIRLYNILNSGTASNKYYANQILQYINNADYSFFITYSNWNGYSFYNAYDYNTSVMYVTFYRNTGLSVTNAEFDNYFNLEIPTRTFTSNYTSYSFMIANGEIEDSSHNARTTLYLPQQLINYVDNNVLLFVNSYNNSDSETLNSILQESEEINDFLNDTTSEDSSYSISQPDVDDSSTQPVETGINNIFNSIMNAFITTERTKIQVPLPFVQDKNIEIDGMFLQDMLRANNGQTLLTIIYSFWNFLLGVFIVKDVQKYIDQAKNGDIATSSDSNIKTDML